MADYNDPRQLLRWQMSGLDDLNTDKRPGAARTARQLRPLDPRGGRGTPSGWTPRFYVPPGYFNDFLHAGRPAGPGRAAGGAGTGPARLPCVWRRLCHRQALRHPCGRAGRALCHRARRAADPAGHAQLLALRQPAVGAGAGGGAGRTGPTASPAWRGCTATRTAWPTSWTTTMWTASWPVAAPEALQQALLAVFTLPGIPVIYYGTEQGLTEPRPSMFGRRPGRRAAGARPLRHPGAAVPPDPAPGRPAQGPPGVLARAAHGAAGPGHRPRGAGLAHGRARPGAGPGGAEHQHPAGAAERPGHRGRGRHTAAAPAGAGRRPRRGRGGRGRPAAPGAAAAQCAGVAAAPAPGRPAGPRLGQ